MLRMFIVSKMSTLSRTNSVLNYKSCRNLYRSRWLRVPAAASTRMNSEPIVLVICGDGHGAHAFAGIASSKPNVEVRVLSLNQDKAQRWSQSLDKGDFTVNLYKHGEKYEELKSKPVIVTSDPGEVIPGCDVIALVFPAFAHEQYLHAIKPLMMPEMILVGLPGQPGFEFQVKYILGNLADEVSLVNIESLPWATRLGEFGKTCNVYGTKDAMMGALRIGSATFKHNPHSLLQMLVGEKPTLSIKGHFLGANLMSANAMLNGSIIYEFWKNWDGRPLDEPPLFYRELTQEAAALLSSMSDEVCSIADAIAAHGPQYDISAVTHFHPYYCKTYDSSIKDKTSIYTAIRTNEACKRIVQAVKPTQDGKWIPEFVNHRLFREGVPYGLVVIRGIAEIMAVQTLNIDKLIVWAQELMGKEYLVDGKIKGKDVRETRAPQRFGFSTLSDLE